MSTTDTRAKSAKKDVRDEVTKDMTVDEVKRHRETQERVERLVDELKLVQAFD